MRARLFARAAGAALLGCVTVTATATTAGATSTRPAATLPRAAPTRPGGALLLSSPQTPRTVSIVMVPSLPGIHFTLDGVSGVTGAGGTATVVDPDLSGAATSLVVPQQSLDANLRVSLDRVAIDPNHGSFSRRLVAELDEDRAVTIRVLTPQRAVVPSAQITSMTLTDSLGRTTKLLSAQLAAPVWLTASRPAQVTNGVAGRLVTYSVSSVMVRGDNVVNSGQLRFDPKQSTLWSVPGSFYTLKIQANDLLAGRPAGGSAVLTYKDKSTRTVPLGPGHRVTVTGLPRGTYNLRVTGGVVALKSLVRLSRNQTATQVVVTLGDVGLVGVIGLSILAILVAAGVLGRRRRHTTAREGASVAPVPA